MVDITSQMIQYIRKTLNQGYGEDQIRTYLLQNGYSASVIEDAFKQANVPLKQIVQIPIVQSSGSKKRIFLWAILCVLVLILVTCITLLLIYYFADEDYVNEYVTDKFSFEELGIKNQEKTSGTSSVKSSVDSTFGGGLTEEEIERNQQSQEVLSVVSSSSNVDVCNTLSGSLYSECIVTQMYLGNINTYDICLQIEEDVGDNSKAECLVQYIRKKGGNIQICADQGQAIEEYCNYRLTGGI